MADYNINAITRRVVFTGSAGVGPYAFSFEVLDQNDVAVYFNTTSLTLTTDYTVTINANGTGSVTLVTGSGVPTTPTASDTVIIIGARDIERVTDFVTAGDLLASSLNEQLDALTIINQQLAEEGQRSMRAPVYDPALVADGGTLDMTLPAKADRVDAVLAFDTDGNPTKGPTVSGITTVTDLAADIATLADIEDGTVATDAISNTAAIASDVTTVGGIASNVTTVAGISADVTTVANNVSGVNSFAQKYRIGASDPTTSLDEGDLFYNTTSDELKVYNGTAWETGVQGASGLLSLTGGTMTGNIAFSGSQTFDGRDLSADGTKLDGIESNATADQTGAEIKALYETEANAFTDAQFTKLAGIETSATADQTASEIRALVESASDSNVFTDADHTKLNGIATGATVYSDNNVDAHLNTSTASASEVLSWNGSDYDWISSGTKLFDESYDGTSTLPSATGTNSVAVGVEAEADSLQASAFGFGALAKGSYSLALGTSYAGGANSVAIGIGDNNAAWGAEDTAQYGIAIGWRAYSKAYNSISIGSDSRASGNNSISLGTSADAQKSASVAIGHSADADVVGKFAYSNRSNTSSNRAQGGYYILDKTTTDATPTLIPNAPSVLLNSATSFSGTIIARESAAAGSDYASWEIKGAMLKNGAGTCVLGNGIVNKIYATSGASTWAVSLSADAYGSNLKIQVTGQASTNILWVATVNTSEVTYA
jgi:hypothetical protein